MAIQIHLEPKVEAALKAEAQKNGLPLSEYVQRILETHVPGQPLESRMTPEERANAFESWSLNFPRRRTTPLPDDAISREAFYQTDNE